MTASSVPGSVEIPGLPEMAWLDRVGDATFSDGRLTMTAGERTDWFNDPGSGSRTSNAPVLVAEQRGDFQLSAKVSVDFASRFDAGVLFVHRNDEHFAKLCFELAPSGEAMVVSVVTNTVSDDANGPVIEGDHVWLRVSAIGSIHAFHYSTDGLLWHMVRLFRLNDANTNGRAKTTLGFLSQSPTGPTCRSRFDELRYLEQTLADPRDGS